MPRQDTAKDQAIRAESRSWLTRVGADLGDLEIAIAMMDPEERMRLMKSRNGRTVLAQNANQSKVKNYRAGLRTPTPDNAFRLGEALRELGVRGVSGFYALYALGFVADLANVLRILARVQKGRFKIAALTMYCIFPIMAAAKDECEGNVLNECARLLAACDDLAGADYRRIWDRAWTASAEEDDDLQFLRYRERPQIPQVQVDILHRRVIAWRILQEWAFGLGLSLNLELRVAEWTFWSWISSLSFEHTWGTEERLAQGSLLALLSEYHKPSNNGSMLLPNNVVIKTDVAISMKPKQLNPKKRGLDEGHNF